MRRDLTMLRALFSGIEIHQVHLDYPVFGKNYSTLRIKELRSYGKLFFFLFNGIGRLVFFQEIVIP